MNWVWDTISNYRKISCSAGSGFTEWKTAREGPVKLGARIEPAAGDRLRLKPKINKDRLKEQIGGISDKRFYRLQKLYLGHRQGRFQINQSGSVFGSAVGRTGSTYTGTMDQVRGLCKAMFGYELPEGREILHEETPLRKGKGLSGIAPVIIRYHGEG